MLGYSWIRFVLIFVRPFVGIVTFLVLSHAIAFAGGDSFLAEIVSLTPTTQDEYRLEIIQHSPLSGVSDAGLPVHVVIFLRFNKRMFASVHSDYASKEKYLQAIDSLKKQSEKGGQFPFGLMSDGYVPIRGRKNEFQSNTLCIIKQHDGQMIVYSFARPI